MKYKFERYCKEYENIGITTAKYLKEPMTVLQALYLED